MVVSLLAVFLCFSLTGCELPEEENTPSEPSHQEEAIPKEEEVIETIDKVTVEVMVTLLNKQIEENSGLGTVFGDPEVKEGLYWYSITDGIYLVVEPVDNPKSIAEDIVRSMRIDAEKDYQDDPQVRAYARLLVVANNEEISFEEAETLLEEAQSSSQEIDSGKGLLIRYTKTSEDCFYQIIRHYE